MSDGDWSGYLVTVDFTLYGLAGREVVAVHASDERMAQARGHREVEAEMIHVHGVASRECGCCLLPECEGGDVSRVHCEVRK